MSLHELAYGSYRRHVGNKVICIKAGEAFEPTPDEIRRLKRRLKPVQEQGVKAPVMDAKTPPAPKIETNDEVTPIVENNTKGLYRTTGRNPYQDVWLKGKILATGQRDCAGRYEVISQAVKHLGKHFTVLDFGAAQGYFSFRLSADFKAKCTLVDADPCLENIVKANGYPHTSVVQKDLTSEQAAELILKNKYDVILALSVIHNYSDWRPVAHALLEASRQGSVVIIETPKENEPKTVNAKQLECIVEYLKCEDYTTLGEWPDRDNQAKRPIMVFGPSVLPLKGVVQDGTGGARKHTILWAPHLTKATGQTIVTGTLNIKLDQELWLSRERAISFPIQIGLFYLWPIKLNGYPCWVAKPPHSVWPLDVPEIMADVNLRKHLKLKNGSRVTLENRKTSVLDEALDISIVTSVFGDYGKYLPRWTKSICALKTKPKSVTVCLSGPSEAENIWNEKCASRLEEAGISWQLVILKNHLGMGRARNEAVRYAKSEWIMHLDVDDLVLPHCLDDVAELAPYCDVVSLGIEFAGYRKGQKPRLFTHASAAAILAGKHCSTSLSPYRKSLWKKRPYIEKNDFVDSVLWTGFAHMGARFLGTSRPCVVYMTRKTGHWASLTETERKAAIAQTLALQKNPELYKKLQLTRKRETPVIKVSHQP